MKQAIEEFLKSKSIAVIGLSRTGRKFGNSVYTELTTRGYEVFAVHPAAHEISGIHCYPNLLALRGKIDAVVLSIAPPGVETVLREAAAIGVKNVWLQRGAESREAIALGEKLGLSVVTGRCVLMYVPPVGGLHAWHRSFNRLFGKL